MTRPRLIAITIVRNEENNYLRPWLKNVSKVADYHVFLDDASDDNTPEIIRAHLKRHPGELHCRTTSLFRENEPKLRNELWEYVRAVAKSGDWIWVVDADEFYDSHMLRLKSELLSNKHPNAQVAKVSCLDMWTSTDYRTDGYWSPVGTDTRLIRYHDVEFGETGTSLHMPPYPASTDIASNIPVWIPKIHFAYLRDCDKKRRYDFYTKNVSAKTDSVSYKHALSIADKDVQLKSYFNAQNTLRAILHLDFLYLFTKRTAKTYGKNNDKTV